MSNLDVEKSDLAYDPCGESSTPWGIKSAFGGDEAALVYSIFAALPSFID